METEEALLLINIDDEDIYLNCNDNIKNIREHIGSSEFLELMKYKNFDFFTIGTYYFETLLLECENIKILKYVIDNCDLECNLGHGCRPIQYICKFANSKVATELTMYVIDKGVELNFEDDEQWQPIHFMCKYSSFEVLKHVIENKGVDLECITRKHKSKPIHLLCLDSDYHLEVYPDEHLDKMIYMLDRFTDLECEEVDKHRPIHYICQYSSLDVLKYMVGKGVNLECETNERYKPIHYVCQRGDPDMLKFMIDQGVDMECETIYGEKPMDIYISRRKTVI